MAEVVVVSAVVLVTLTALYISYNKVLSVYKTRLTYNDVTVLYRLAYYRDRFLNKTTGQNVLNDDTININKSNTNYLASDDFLCAANNTYTCEENIFIVYNNKNRSLDNDSLNSFVINETYKDYVRYLSDSVDLSNSDYVMLMEYCESDKENCKYAYLELKEEA